MFGIGMSEMIIILAVALLVFGPTKLPEIAKSIAKGMRELRRAGDDLRASVNLDDDEPRRRPPPRPTPLPETPAEIPGSSLATGKDEAWPRAAEGTAARGTVDVAALNQAAAAHLADDATAGAGAHDGARGEAPAPPSTSAAAAATTEAKDG